MMFGGWVERSSSPAVVRLLGRLGARFAGNSKRKTLVAVCLGSNGQKMGSIDAAGAEIDVAGDDVLRAAGDDRFH